MRSRTKKMLALLLSAAMVFTMNTFVMAEEVPAEVEIKSFEKEEGTEVSDHFNVFSDDSQSGNAVSLNFTPDVVKEISENLLSMSANLAGKTGLSFNGKNYTYFIVHTRAVGYEGFKLDYNCSNKYDPDKYTGVYVSVFFAPVGTVSAADYDYIMREDTDQYDLYNIFNETKFNCALLKSVKIKQGKGATVKINGEGIVPARKSAYISSIVIDAREMEEVVGKEAVKEMNKEIKDHLKGEILKLKKGKDFKVSANGLKEGSDKEEDSFKLTIAVYPAYIGTYVYDTSIDAAFSAVFGGEDHSFYDMDFETVVSSITGSVSLGSLSNIKSVRIGNKSDSGMCKKFVKIKNGRIKSIKTGFTHDDKFKSETLKPTKNAEKKHTGLASTGEAYTYFNPKTNLSFEVNKVEADGNFFGTIFYPLNLDE